MLPTEASYFVPLLSVVGGIVAFVTYTVIAEYRAGRTLGKRLMGIQVVRESGARISLGQSVLWQIPFIGHFFFIDALFALFTKRRQRAFELLTKTRAIALLICMGMLTPTASAAQANGMDVGAPLGRSVDIGGRKLHLHCVGAGSPTVVLESGASSFAVDWALVQPDVAKTNRVCSYDRAGMGWSDGGEPERADRVVRDLHSLLVTAGEKPPYVLVGASRGGIYTRIYQRRYPAEVVGMVQVDPSHEGGLFTMVNGRAVTIASLTPDELLATIPQGRPQRPPIRNPQTGAPFDRLPANLYPIRIEFERRFIAMVTNADITRELVVDVVQGEHAALSELLQASRASEHPLGDLPIVVLTRGLDSGQEQRERHASLAAQSTRGRHEVIQGSYHEIHLSHPAAVVKAIQEVITESRRP
jgi:pimeloyl-ACP methyl ester carboxylesterase